MDAGKSLIERRRRVTPAGLGMVTPFTVVSGEGAVLKDENGKEYIDFASGIGVTTAGNCPPSVVKAVQDQAAKLIHTCFMVATYEPYVALCEELVALFPHGPDSKVLLTTTGAESVENAIKIARQATGRSGIICYTGAFHGRTMMAMTLTSKIAYKRGCGPFAPEVYRLPFPSYFHRGDGLDEKSFIARELARLEDAFHTMIPADEVAAIIVEPVLGEGGFIPVPTAYLQGLRRICDNNGILLIIDEVQTGFCRTGSWACYQQSGVVPDISTWAKALGSGVPIGAVIGRADVMDKAAPGTIGGTYPGPPLGCAAALATIAFMKEQDLNGKSRAVGAVIREAFENMQKRCPNLADIRGMGAMIAVELCQDGDPDRPDSDLTGKWLKACWDRGLLVIPAGTYKNVIRILVPLVIDQDLLRKGLQIMDEALTEVWTG